jgi:16S rRNA (uracil1498-N3)-methyltransferase
MRSAADAAPSFLYLPDLATCPGEFRLNGEEARYLARVVRAREGECVTASDGAGSLATLAVERTRPDVVLRVVERRTVPRPGATRLMCGAPEGERGDWLVEKLAELGVSELVPVETQRARWTALPRRERWERLATAALRQSRSAWRLRIGEPVELRAGLGAIGAGARWLADPGGVPGAAMSVLPDQPVTGAVGPSSGFSEDEHKLLLSNGFVAVCLASLRLRTETAAVALAALWAAGRAPGPRPREGA